MLNHVSSIAGAKGKAVVHADVTVLQRRSTVRVYNAAIVIRFAVVQTCRSLRRSLVQKTAGQRRCGNRVYQNENEDPGHNFASTVSTIFGNNNESHAQGTIALAFPAAIICANPGGSGAPDMAKAYLAPWL
jgi:hypothetical protein